MKRIRVDSLVAALMTLGIGVVLAILNFIQVARFAPNTGPFQTGFMSLAAWLGASTACGLYVYVSASFLSRRSASSVSIIRVLGLLSAVLGVLAIPIAVGAVVDLLRYLHPEIVSIHPGYLVQWLPIAIAVTMLRITLRRVRSEEHGAA